MMLGDLSLACHTVFSGYAESQRLAAETGSPTLPIAQLSEMPAESAKARYLKETSGPFTNGAGDA